MKYDLSILGVELFKINQHKYFSTLFLLFIFPRKKMFLAGFHFKNLTIFFSFIFSSINIIRPGSNSDFDYFLQKPKT